MSGGAEGVGDCMASCVDQESNHNARGHDFRIGALLLVQVPSATNAQELATVAPAVQEDDHQVDDLQAGREKDAMRSCQCVKINHIPATPRCTARRMSNIANTPGLIKRALISPKLLRLRRLLLNSEKMENFDLPASGP